MLIARLVGALIGHPYETEWACWTNLVSTPTYACEYRGDAPLPLYIAVTSDGIQYGLNTEATTWDQRDFHEVVIGIDDAMDTIIYVDPGNAPIYYTLEIDGEPGLWHEMTTMECHDWLMGCAYYVRIPPSQLGGNARLLSYGHFDSFSVKVSSSPGISVQM